MMSCTYIHAYTQWWTIFSGLAAGFCLHLSLFSAGNPLFSEGAGCSYTVPCCYLHCTIARSKITDWPNAPRPFYPRTVMCHPPGGSPNRLTLVPLTLCLLLRTYCWHRFVFLSYRFGTRLFKLQEYLSSQLIIIRHLCLL